MLIRQLTFAGLGLAWSVLAVAAPISVTDDIGRVVSLPAPAMRIVSLAPHLTEILFALGVGQHIQGTVQYSDYPPLASAVPRLGDAFSVNVEAVLAMSPDIVFAWRSGGSNRAIEKLVDLGVPVYFNEAPRLEDIAIGVRKMGRLVGRVERGEALATAFEQALVAARHVGAPSVRVFFQISDQSLYTVNADHLIGQAIDLCGGVNLFADAMTSVPFVGVESVLVGRPDLIIITHVPGAPLSPWLETWQRYPVFKGRIASIDPNLISRPGLRMQEGIAAMCTLIREASQ